MEISKDPHNNNNYTAKDFFQRFLIGMMAFLLILSLYQSAFLPTPVFSDEADELEEELNETKEQKLYKEKILKETQAELDGILNSSWSIAQKIAALEDQITSLERDISRSEKEISEKNENIESHQSEIDKIEIESAEVSSRLYKNSRLTSLGFFLKTDAANEILRTYVLKKYTLNHQLEKIASLNYQLGDLEEKRKLLDQEKLKLEAENEALAESREVLAKEREELSKQVAAASAASGQLKNEISLLNNKISELQKAILMARSGSFVPSVGSVPPADDYNASAEGFRTKAPAGSFAVFSIGAYTHRKGMSQYGAMGRAMKGQSANDIVKAYYGKLPVKRDTSGNISVQGYGSMDFETTYMYGIAEMQETFPLEALKAQAIVARSYAYRYKRDATTICTTQSCQVFYKPKSDNPPAIWKRAVDETKGIMVEGVTTYYSSTAGGYLIDSGWDTTNGTGGDANWMDRAYETIAGSPWFYKAWYTKGFYPSTGTCGRFPWMNEAEMADILNTWLVMKRNGVKGSVDDSRILPITVNTCQYGASGTPYSMQEMKNLLNNPVTSISGYPAVSFTANGQTGSVSFSTNRGIVSISGKDFKSVFNTRAPGFLSIPQSSWAGDFTFINIERKL